MRSAAAKGRGSGGEASSSRPEPGLCGRCVHARRVVSDRGSVFWLCRLARTDDRFARYPRLPVRDCEGHAPAAGDP